MKMSFTLLEHHIETIAKFATNAHIYAQTTKHFLESNGWSEEDYYLTLSKHSQYQEHLQ